MNIKLLFDSLNKDERKELYVFLNDYMVEISRARVRNTNSNKEIIEEWSRGLASMRLFNGLLNYFKDTVISKDILNELDNYDFRRMRNVGKSCKAECRRYIIMNGKDPCF